MANSGAVQAVTGEIFREGWSRVRGSMQGLGSKHQQKVRAAKGHRAAVFKAIKTGGCQTKGELSNQLEYLTTKSSHIVDSRGVLDGKKTLSSDEIKGLTDRFSSRWNDGFRPKMGHTTHMLMSYPVGTSGADVRDISSAVCEKFFQNEHRNFDYVIAVHEDRAHPHAHIVLNRRSQEGEYFYLGRDHHFNYDDFRLSMVDEAEKVGVRLEATRRIDRGDTTYAPRTKEIYDAKKEGREPLQRERVGRDLDRALADIATASKIYKGLAVEASRENREDISNALFRAGEILAQGREIEAEGEIYMDNQESFDELRTSFNTRAERIEQLIKDAPASEKAGMEKKLDSVYAGISEKMPLGLQSSKLNEAASANGVYSETNINKDGVGLMKEPETRAQIETALRGTGISSTAVIARVEQGASNASLEQRWIADDLTKIAENDGLNLEKKEDLRIAADKLDQVHVRLGETLQRADVIRDDGVILSDEQERPSDVDVGVRMQNAAGERLETDNVAKDEAIEREVIADIDRGVRDQFDQQPDQYSRFEALSIERDPSDGKVDGVAMGVAFTQLAQDRDKGPMSDEDRRRTEIYLRDTADKFGDQMLNDLSRDDTREFRSHEHEDYERYSEEARQFERERLREFDNAVRPYRTGMSETEEMRRVIEHERNEKITGPFDETRPSDQFRDDIERELDDEQIEALRNGDPDALEKVIDDRLDRLYAAKAYLQSDADTANSEAAREVVSEIADEEFDAQRLRTSRADTEKGQTHG